MEKAHCRKQLRLSEYDYSQAGAYFITVCTKERKQLLGSIVGADDHIGPYTKLSTIGEIVDRYTREIPGIDQFVILPDHVHMILLVSAEKNDRRADVVIGPYSKA